MGFFKSMGKALGKSVGVGVSSGGGTDWGSLIGGGLDLGLQAGGMFLDSAQKRQQARFQADQNREAAQNSIQYRVADAKKAGIHPLAALGANVQGSSPMFLNDTNMAEGFRSMGQTVRDTARQFRSPAQIAQDDMALRVAASQERQNNSMAQYYDSLAAKERMQQVGPPNGLGIVNEMGQNPGNRAGFSQTKPSNKTSASTLDPSTAAGPADVFWENTAISPGMKLRVPHLAGQGPVELMSEANPITWGMILAENMRYYGKNWLPDFLRSVGGHAPFQNYPDQVITRGRKGGPYPNAYQDDSKPWYSKKNYNPFAKPNFRK